MNITANDIIRVTKKLFENYIDPHMFRYRNGDAES